MSYIGKTPTSVPLTSSDITDGIISLPKLTDGTDGNLISYDASGNPVAVATGNDGQVLTSTGAGSPPVFEAIPSGGITQADQWSITGNHNATNASDADISSGWIRNPKSGFAYIGNGMTQSSGVFTFPATGIYTIEFNIQFYINNGASNFMAGFIFTTQNNSSYALAADSMAQMDSQAGNHTSAYTHTIFDCTNTSTHKVKFLYNMVGTAGKIRTSDAHNSSFVTFTKLANT